MSDYSELREKAVAALESIWPSGPANAQIHPRRAVVETIAPIYEAFLAEKDAEIERRLQPDTNIDKIQQQAFNVLWDSVEAGEPQTPAHWMERVHPLYYEEMRKRSFQAAKAINSHAEEAEFLSRDAARLEGKWLEAQQQLEATLGHLEALTEYLPIVLYKGEQHCGYCEWHFPKGELLHASECPHELAQNHLDATRGKS